jgi:hypothetical protein
MIKSLSNIVSTSQKSGVVSENPKVDVLCVKSRILKMEEFALSGDPVVQRDSCQWVM